MRAQSLDTFDPIDTDIESSQEVQHPRSAKRLHPDNASPRKSPSFFPSVRKEQERWDKPYVVPPFPKSSLDAVASPVLDQNNKLSDSGTKTQLQATLSELVHSPVGIEVVSNAVRQALVPETRQQVDEPLPWEIHGQDQAAAAKVPEIAEQQGENREAKTAEEEKPSANAIQRDQSRVSKDNEVNGDEKMAVKVPFVDLSEKQGEKASSADENLAQETTIDHQTVEETLTLESKVEEEEANRTKLADGKRRAEKIRAEKLAQEQKAKEEEIRKKAIANKEAKAAQKRAWDKERYALNKACKKDVKQQTPADAKKAQDVKEVPTGSEPLARDMAKESKVSNKVVKGTKRKATSPSLEVKPAKTPTLDERLSARDRNSSTPSSTRSDPDRVRSSMTPAVPGVMKRPSDSGNPTMTSRLSAQTPLRSALRQNPSNSRRSVSFIAELSDPVKLNSSPSTAAAGKLNESKSKQSLVKAVEDEYKPRASSTPRSSVSRSSETPKQSKDSSKKPATKEKVQTKLKVRCDKKMKGREVDPPLKVLEPPSQKEIVIPSDSEKSVSTFYSDEDDRPRNAKAGPSCKKKPNTVEERGAATTNPSSTPDLPASKLWELSSQDAETTFHKAIPKVVMEAPARTKSPSRSPAQYMSRADSASSSSRSESGSEPESGGESDSESRSESGTASDVEPKLRALPRVENEKDEAKPPLSEGAESGDVEMVDASSIQSTSSTPASQSSQRPSVGPQGTKKLKEDDTQRLARDADRKMQRESRQSLDPSSAGKRSKTPEPHHVKVKHTASANKPMDPDHPVRQRGKPSSNSNRESLKEKSTVLPKPALKPANHPGKNLRPANQRYSSITEIMKQPKAKAKSQPLRNKPAVLQDTTAAVADDSESSSSESESESMSDDDGDVPMNDASASQVSTTSENKATSGFKGVMKRMLPWIFPD